MPHSQAAKIVAMRQIVDDMIIKTANNPVIIDEPEEDYERARNSIRALSRSNAGKHHGNAEQFGGGPPR